MFTSLQASSIPALQSVTVMSYREDETVNTFCCVIESLESDKQFPKRMYQFLASHEDLNPLIFPSVGQIQQKNGGAGILKNMY